MNAWTAKIEAVVREAKRQGVRLEAGLAARVHARKADLALTLGEPPAEVAKHLDRAAVRLQQDARTAALGREFQAEARRLATPEVQT